MMTLTETGIIELQRRASGSAVRAEPARHARLILLRAEGLTWAQIRTKPDCSDSYVDRWSKRFAADRLAAVCSRHAGRERYNVTDHLAACVRATQIREVEVLRPHASNYSRFNRCTSLDAEPWLAQTRQQLAQSTANVITVCSPYPSRSSEGGGPDGLT
ncbi:helix-turn-helix domain-containing protein [Paraburkholderia xenovorans]|nr:helix-turn-helix domain-containing protein [Paraburkholderia xenovorans]